jgi:hypothetical protein
LKAHVEKKVVTARAIVGVARAALDVLRIVVDHELVGEAELRAALLGAEQAGLNSLLGCLEAGQPRLRIAACAVLRRVLEVYGGAGAVLGREAGPAEAVAAAVARRVHDTHAGIRLAALRLAAELGRVLPRAACGTLQAALQHLAADDGGPELQRELTRARDACCSVEPLSLLSLD